MNTALTPVTVVTGFLGSGKTTVIAHLLRDARLADTAVIVNEFGEVGLDHALLEVVDQEVVLLPQGCLCCALNGTLAGTLEALDIRRLGGQVPFFRRVVVETSGLADPAPVLQTLLDRSMLMRGFVPSCLVTTVDLVAGLSTLDRYAEAVRQVALADRVLLTKGDLAGEARELKSRINALNPHAPLIVATHGAVPSREVIDDGESAIYRMRRRFTAEPVHEREIKSTVLRFSRPVSFERLADWLAELIASHGERLLRVKGLVAIENEAHPVALHGVQHIFHPPRFLDIWPDGRQDSVIVFISDGLDPATIHASAATAGLQGREEDQIEH